MALPASVGMFFQTMYSIVDSFYAGQISAMDLAAMGLSFPVYLILVAACSGTTRGASALIANAVGSEDVEAQRVYISQSISLGFVLSMFLTFAGLFLVTPLFKLMGADGVYLTKALIYTHTIFTGSVFFVISNLSNGILMAYGDSKTYSRVLIVGFFLNIILDPWFVYGGLGLPAMGIFGIGLATVLILVVTFLILFGTVIRRGLVDVSDWRSVRSQPTRLWRDLDAGASRKLQHDVGRIGFFRDDLLLAHVRSTRRSGLRGDNPDRATCSTAIVWFVRRNHGVGGTK